MEPLQIIVWLICLAVATIRPLGQWVYANSLPIIWWIDQQLIEFEPRNRGAA